jgi:hypothetical protein
VSYTHPLSGSDPELIDARLHFINYIRDGAYTEWMGRHYSFLSLFCVLMAFVLSELSYRMDCVELKSEVRQRTYSDLAPN